MSGHHEGMIRTWRIQDGNEVGKPMNAGSAVYDIAVSRDGKWIVSGTENGLMTVWNAKTRKSHEKSTKFKHASRVNAVDVSPNGTKIASGSDDKTIFVWSLATNQRLLGALKHDNWVTGAKFSPDGCLIATATWNHDSVRVYNSQNGHLLIDVPIQVKSYLNQSLTWAIDGKQLFVLSHDGNIHYLDPSRGTRSQNGPSTAARMLRASPWRATVC